MRFTDLKELIGTAITFATLPPDAQAMMHRSLARATTLHGIVQAISVLDADGDTLRVDALVVRAILAVIVSQAQVATPPPTPEAQDDDEHPGG